MDIRHLETFVAVCKRKSFSDAARDLYTTQPTVSNHISAIESELNTTLILRSSRNVMLTKQGEIFYEFAKQTISERNRIFNDINTIEGDSGGAIEIASSTVPEIYILPAVIKTFLEKYPATKFKLYHMDSAKVIDQVENKNVGIGLTGYKRTKSLLKYTKLCDDKLVIIEGKNAGFISEEKEVSLSSLDSVPFIVREEGSGSKTSFFEKIKNVKIVAEAESEQLIKQLVESGVGISVVSENSLSDEEKSRFNIYTVKNLPFCRTLYLAEHPSTLLSIKEQHFRELLLKFRTAKNITQNDF